MTEYTPSEARVCIDYCNAVVARRRPDDEGEGMAEADAEFDRFLARVRRDAAREALNRFAQEVDANGSWLPGTDPHSPRARAALNYRDTHYPEETP